MQPANNLIERVGQACPELSSLTRIPFLFNDNTLTDPILHYIKETKGQNVGQKDQNLFNELCTLQPMSQYTAQNFINAAKNIINKELQTVHSSPRCNEIIQSLKSLYEVAYHFVQTNANLFDQELLTLNLKISEAERNSYTNVPLQQPQINPQVPTQNFVKHPPRFEDGKNDGKVDLSPIAQNGINVINNNLPPPNNYNNYNNNNNNPGGYGATPAFQMPPQNVPQVGLNNNNYSPPSGFANPPISPPQTQPQQLNSSYPQQQPLNSSYPQQQPPLQQPPISPGYPQQPPPQQQQQYNPNYQNYPPQQQQYYPQQQQPPLQQSMYGMPRGVSSSVLPPKKVYPEYTAEMHYGEQPPPNPPPELTQSQQIPPQQPSQQTQATQQLWAGVGLIEQGRIDEGVAVLEQIYNYLEDKHKQLVASIIKKYKK